MQISSKSQLALGNAVDALEQTAMVESFVSHQGDKEDARGDLQAFQERMSWVENQAAVTIPLPCAPSMLCPLGGEALGVG